MLGTRTSSSASVWHQAEVSKDYSRFALTADEDVRVPSTRPPRLIRNQTCW